MPGEDSVKQIKDIVDSYMWYRSDMSLRGVGTIPFTEMTSHHAARILHALDRGTGVWTRAQIDALGELVKLAYHDTLHKRE